VSVLVSVTVTLGTTAPDGSVMVPVRAPVPADCAISDGAEAMVTSTSKKSKIRVAENILDVIIFTFCSFRGGLAGDKGRATACLKFPAPPEPTILGMLLSNPARVYGVDTGINLIDSLHWRIPVRKGISDWFEVWRS
jgi:hypothetical protein